MKKTIMMMLLGALLVAVPAAAEATEKAEAALRQAVEQEAKKYTNVTVKVEDGVVTLSGAVETATEKEFLLRGVSSVKGVTAVNDTVQVRSGDSAPIESEDPTVVEYLDDAAVTAEVNAGILAQEGLRSLNISVETTDGIVTLAGKADNKAQVSLAEKTAAATKGVKRVVNTLTVK